MGPNGEDAQRREAEGARRPETVSPSVNRLVQVARLIVAGLWPVLLIALIVFYNLDIPRDVRSAILYGVIGVIVLGGVVTFVWAKRRLTSVARVAAFLILLLVVLIAALIPAVFLEPSGRIILLKLGGILFLSLLPGLLYLQFIALRREALRAEFVLNLHRLDIDTYANLPRPPEGSLWHREGDRRRGERENVYLQKFDAAYGAPLRSRYGSVETGHNLLPIVLCTVLLAVGWALVLQPEPIAGSTILGTTLSGLPILPAEALRFGFAGAYLFILEMLVRRYFQDDLKTSAYINASARILAVALLVTAVHQVWPAAWGPAQENAFAFVVGVFPLVGLKALQNLVAKPLRGLIPSLKQEYPLSDLDGLNIWYEARLLEEGVEDMQNLATASLVDVMIRTRVPVDRLVDWVDQAHLFLRVSNRSPGKDPNDSRKDLPSDRQKLRFLGVRTATDLEDAFRHPVLYRPGGGLEERQIPEPEDFDDKLMGALNRDGDGFPSVTLAVLRSLAREPNLHHVRSWKSYPRALALARRQRRRRARATTSPLPPSVEAGTRGVTRQGGDGPASGGRS